MNSSFERPTAVGGTVAQAAVRTGRALGRAELLARRVPVPPPWLVLGLLVLASWGITAEVGRVAQHDHWLFYAWGDDTWYYTSAWRLAHGHLPFGAIGYGYPVLIAPFARVAGPNILKAQPSITIFNQLVLAPIALLCIYGIVRTFARRWYAYLATLLWVVFPVLVIHYFLADYHSRYVDQILPSEVGLTTLGDYPSMVVLLVAAYFLVRHVATGAGLDVVAAGLATGVALTIKPANGPFVVAALLALAVARRPRGLVTFVLALVPVLIGLTIWKYRSVGHLPLLSADSSFNWPWFHHNIDGLREFTWSQRMIFFTAVGGTIGLARRSIVTAVLAGGWIGAFLLLKGSSPAFDITSGTFFTHLIAAFPGYFLAVVSVPFLVPVYGGRRPPVPFGPATSRTLPKVACGLLGAVTAIGVVAVAVLPSSDASAAVEFPNAQAYVPAGTFPLTGRLSGGRVRLSWPLQQPYGTRASYAVFRNSANPTICTDHGNGVRLCAITGHGLTTVDGSLAPGARPVSSYVDKPPPGRWWYVVALSATPVGPQTSSDIRAVSTPAVVTVPRAGAG